MPVLDGPASIRMLSEHPECESLRLYGESGLERQEAGASLGPNGVDRWYTKPINAKLLAQEMVSAFLLCTPKAQDQLAPGTVKFDVAARV
jgi:hypothetical protein